VQYQVELTQLVDTIFVDIANIFSSSVRRGKGFTSRDCDIGCFSRFA
jgi:hypothetical protein